MTKKIVVVALMLCLACGSIFAFGIGVQGGTDVANNAVTGVAVTFKLTSFPLLFAVEIPSFDPFAIGISGDYWILNPSITGGRSWSLNWYVGAGIFGDVFIGIGKDVSFGVGARIPVGLNIFFLRGILEAYLQVAPGLELEIDNGVGFDFVCPINYGLRVWIN